MVTINEQNINVRINEQPVIANISNQTFNVEVSNRNGLDSNITPKIITFQSGLEFQLNLQNNNIANFRNILFFNPNNEIISVLWYYDTNYLYVESNIDLLNHKILIS